MPQQININEIFNEIEEVVQKQYSNNNFKNLLLCITNAATQNYFFKKAILQSSDPVSWLIPLTKKKFFANTEISKLSPEDGYEPYWPPIDYLENVARLNSEQSEKEITNTLVKIIGEIIKNNKKGTNNSWIDRMVISIISYLPLEKIKATHIKFIKNIIKADGKFSNSADLVIQGFLPKLIEMSNTKYLLEIIKVLIDFKREKESYGEQYKQISGGDKYLLKLAFTEKNKKSLADICPIEITQIVLKKIDEIIKEDKTQFYVTDIPAIEDHQQTKRVQDRYPYILISLLRDMLLAIDSKEISQEFFNLLSKRHPIYKRLILYTINKKYNDLKGQFWDWAAKIKNPLNQHYTIKHEMYNLLENNQDKLTQSQINTVIDWIENKKYYLSKNNLNNPESKKKYLAYQKKKWLSSIKNHKKAAEKYSYYNSINDAPLEHPDFDFWMGDITYLSDKEDDEIFSKSAEEIVSYLNNYKGDEWGRDLGGALGTNISMNPKKYSENIEAFLGIKSSYQKRIFEGFKGAWMSNQDVDWEKILDFMEKFFSSKNFERNTEGAKDIIIYNAVDLIDSGLNKDVHAFSLDLLPKAKKNILNLADKASSKSFVIDPSNIVLEVLNSPKGKIYSTLLNYALRYAKINKEKFKNDERWEKDIKEFFTTKLNRGGGGSQPFFVVLGQYFSNLAYLDYSWVEKNINKIFNKDEDADWTAAFTGYLYYSRTVYKDLYELLKKEGHIEKALEINLKDLGSNIEAKFIQSVCLAYGMGLENLKQ
ncbi:hypothetical protein HN928_05905, partial [bacterium]|nr:hypothetical protein [bacterium]